MLRHCIGNGIDLRKGAVLHELQKDGLLTNLVVEPMARPHSLWTKQDWERYAKALRLQQRQVTRHEVLWGANQRQAYFAELNCHEGRDFFLDPDAGVATGKKTQPKHVRPKEVLSLLKSRNVVAVYQHRSRRGIRERVKKVAEAIQRVQPQSDCLAYMDKEFALLFLSRQPLRLDSIAACLEGPSFNGSLARFRPDRRFLTRVMLLNYKSVAASDIALEQVSFLVGPNGSGKSNFLDALRFIADALNASLDQALRVRGGISLVRRHTRNGVQQFGMRLEFELPASFGWYALAVNAKGVDGYEIGQEECHFVQRNDGRKHFYKVKRGSVVDASIPNPPAAASDRLYLVSVSGLRAFRHIFDALAGMKFSNPTPDLIRTIQPSGNSRRMERDGSNLASVLGGLEQRSPGFKKRIDQYLGSIVPGVVKTGRWPTGTGETIEFWQGSKDGGRPLRLPASSMSDGTLRTLGILVALFQGAEQDEPARQLLGIEEPEAALHPGAAEALADAIREAALNAQVLVTSHSPELLQSFPAGSIIVVAADRGATRIGPVDEVSRSAIRDRLFTAGDLLRMDQLNLEQPDFAPSPALDLFGAAG